MDDIQLYSAVKGTLYQLRLGLHMFKKGAQQKGKDSGRIGSEVGKSGPRQPHLYRHFLITLRSTAVESICISLARASNLCLSIIEFNPEFKHEYERLS